ncbi:MAG: hypothetical protein MJ252_22120 [archaeon]|nr:hypothetical protein [archaeon]
MEFTKKLTNNYLTVLVKRLETKRAFPSWRNSTQEYSSIFDSIIEDQKKNCLEEKRKETVVRK